MRITLLFLFSCFIQLVTGQTVAEKIEQIVSLKPRPIEKYEVRKRPNQLVLQTAFNNASYSDKDLLKSLANKVVLKVELVYTTYKKSETFDQHTLNRKRLESFFSAAPSCVSQSSVEWILWAQTGCVDAEQGKDFFHGVVVTYREQPSEVLSAVEQEFIREVAKGKIKSYAYDTYERRETAKLLADSTSSREPDIRLPQFPGGDNARIAYFQRNLTYPKGAVRGTTVDVQFVIGKDGHINKIIFPNSTGGDLFKDQVSDFIENMPPWIPGKMDGKPVECMVQFSVDFTERGRAVASPLEIFTTERPPKKSALPAFNYDQVKPTLDANQVSNALSKLNLTKALIVADVTGSMAPYNAQVIEYIAEQLRSKKGTPNYFVFFNDGDNIPDKNKKVGNVGGIYTLESNNLDSIVDLMLKAMRNGYGGDLKENNLEAVLKGIAQFPEMQEVVMLSDNFASPRDMSLLSQITIPVHVIACGGKLVNEDYLLIARKTKGSFSFAGIVYNNLHELKEGDKLTIGHLNYVLKNEKFVLKR